MPRAPKEYRRTRIIVAGKGHFPSEMLCHDSCAPESKRDVVLIDAFSTIPREIALRRFSRDGHKVDARRWLSFGWTVVYDEGI